MTEIGLSFSALRAQLENEKSSLYKIDENIKKIVQTSSGRFPNDRFNPAGEYTRGGNRVGGRNSLPDGGNNYKNDEHFGKRKQETKTVFSRLSARVQDSDGEEELPTSGPAPVVKRVRMPSAVSRELPTRAAVLRAQGGDELAKSRNRRMFGSLLGTLQKFKQEEIVLQTKEEKKAQVERKIEEAARLEKEREHKERKTLFAEREHKKATIKALEAKMGRVAEFERWEASQKHLGNFILTKAQPHVYWIPKKMSEKAEEKLLASRKFHEKYMWSKRAELQEELQRIEQRVLRRGQPAPASAPAHTPAHTPTHTPTAAAHGEGLIKQEDNDKGKRRDKFAMDVDKDESDGDDGHEHEMKGDSQYDSGTNGVQSADPITKEIDVHKVTEAELQTGESKIETTEHTENITMEVEDAPVPVAAESTAAIEPTPATESTVLESTPAIESTLTVESTLAVEPILTTQAPTDESTQEDKPAKDNVETVENHS